MRASNFLLIPLVLCVANAAAAQVVLDNFEEGPISLTLDPMDLLVFDTQQNLNTANVLSGVRESQLFTLDFKQNHGGATLDLSLSGGDDALQFAATQPAGQGFDLIYEFAQPLDLAALGSSFSVEIDALVDPEGEVLVEVFVGDGFDSASVSADPSMPGTIVLPFSGLLPAGPLGPDLSSVTSITLSLTTTVGGLNNVAATLDDFLVVPEPSSGLLANAALLTLAGLRARRRTQGST